MKKELVNCAYIDNTNLYKGCEAEGFKIGYAKFRKYLGERHSVKTAYMFMGFVLGNEEMYTQLQEAGYTLVFKPTVLREGGIVKGNCDAELVLQAVSDFYEKKFQKAVIVTSDGDFACLVKFLIKHDAIDRILSPRGEEKCSSLYKENRGKDNFSSSSKKPYIL